MDNFNTMCHLVDRKLKADNTKFYCGFCTDEFMWIAGKEGTIGGWPCHFELCADGETKNTPTPGNNSPNHEKDRVYVELHIEGSSHKNPNGLFQNLIKEVQRIAKTKQETLYEFENAEYHGFRLQKDKDGFPNDCNDKNIEDILQALYALATPFADEIQDYLKKHL